MVKWLNKEQIDGSDINLVIENSLYGQILEVDLKYSNKLHILHNDYPLLGDVSNLIPKLSNKSRYILDYLKVAFISVIRDEIDQYSLHFKTSKI